MVEEKQKNSFWPKQQREGVTGLFSAFLGWLLLWVLICGLFPLSLWLFGSWKDIVASLSVQITPWAKLAILASLVGAVAIYYYVKRKVTNE